MKIQLSLPVPLCEEQFKYLNFWYNKGAIVVRATDER